jgi:hypothetical protein
MISVVNRKLMTSDESFFTRAPITPRDVRRKYSKGLDLDVVLRKGYRKSGMWATHRARDQYVVASRGRGLEMSRMYRSGREYEYRCGMLRIVAGPAHCRHG